MNPSEIVTMIFFGFFGILTAYSFLCFTNRWRKYNKYLTIFGLFIASEGLFLSLGAWINRDIHRTNLETENENLEKERLMNIGRKREVEACEKFGFSNPEWGDGYRFTCVGQDGVVKEIRPPKCSTLRYDRCK